MKNLLKMTFVFLIFALLSKSLFAMNKEQHLLSTEYRRNARPVTVEVLSKYHIHLTEKLLKDNDEALKHRAVTDSLVKEHEYEVTSTTLLTEKITALEDNLKSTKEDLATVLSKYDQQQATLLALASKYDQQQEINATLRKDLANLSSSNNSTRVVAFSGFFGFIIYKIFIKVKWIAGH